MAGDEPIVRASIALASGRNSAASSLSRKSDDDPRDDARAVRVTLFVENPAPPKGASAQARRAPPHALGRGPGGDGNPRQPAGRAELVGAARGARDAAAARGGALVASAPPERVWSWREARRALALEAQRRRARRAVGRQSRARARVESVRELARMGAEAGDHQGGR